MTSTRSGDGGPASSDRQSETVQGVLINVCGTGVLLTGAAGIGKSTCALELVARGHQLVADDVVSVTRDGQAVIGTAPKQFAGLIAVRALGILDARKLFGNKACAARCAIDLCIDLHDISETELPDPMVPWAEEFEILGVKVRRLILPVGGGGHLAVLVETASRLVRTAAVSPKSEAA